MTTTISTADPSRETTPAGSRRTLVRLALVVGVLVLLALVVFAGISVFAADPMAGT